MRNQYFLIPLKKGFFILIFLLVVLRCSDEHLVLQTSTTLSSSSLTTIKTTEVVDCLACTYVVPAGQLITDGIELGLQPGSVIGLDAQVNYGTLIFRNIKGTLENPIIIKNCGGTARVNGNGNFFAIKTTFSEHFRISGGNTHKTYGIIVTGATVGVTLDKLSTQFEVDHLEVHNVKFAGIMAKTDPSCDDATVRGNFLMKGISLHHNYIHDTGGEGIYAGNSFFMGMNTPCGVRLPHEIHYIRIFSNVIKNSGWEAIQLGCATKGASIYGNTIENYGVANKLYQNNGIQIGAGTGGVCYNNLIKKGTGNGLIVMGLGDNIIYNNIIDHPGNFGVFCDERYSPGPGFKFLNNTIICPKSDGIRIFAELVPMNVIVNNIIVNPGSYSSYVYPLSPADAFINKLSADVKIDTAKNYFTMDTLALQIDNTLSQAYKVKVTSPVIDQGADISAHFNIKTDFYFKPRIRGLTYDIGAIEHY